MRRCVWCLVAGGVVGLCVGLVYRAVRPAPKPPAPATINITPPAAGTSGPSDEAAWRYRLCQPRHWRYLLLNN
jgi:hypothetical protein